MYSGNLDTSDVLLNRGLNGGYNFGGQGNFLGDGSAVNANVTANRDLGVLESVNGGVRDQFLGNQIDRGHTAITDNINTGNQFLSDRIWSQGIDSKFAAVTAAFASAERLEFANHATLQREMNANQMATMNQLHAIDLKQTECCCKLEAGQAAIIAKLDAQALADLRDSNNRLNTEIQIRNNVASVNV